MFFTSGILIAFFCFAFYLIWNQFLKKDTRLSTGLQLLRKKISELENLSVNVSAQMERQMSLARDKVEDLELLLKSAKENSDRLEQLIQTTQTLGEQAPLQDSRLRGNDKVNEHLQQNDQAPLQDSRLRGNDKVNEHLQQNDQAPLQDSRLRGNDKVNEHLQQNEQAPLQAEQAAFQAEELVLSQIEKPRPVPKPKTSPSKPQKEPSLQFGESPFTSMDTGMDFLNENP